MRRPFAYADWNVRACGTTGHVTYEPDERDLAERLTTETLAGTAWRCLRCGDFVLGEPHGSGPADEAPIVMRGKALRDAFILRLLAFERGVRGLLLLALAFGIYKFDGAKDSLHKVFTEYLPTAKSASDKIGINLQESGPVKLIQKALETHHSTLRWVAVGVLAYGALELLEAVGLWLMKRWGEYVAVVGTSVFIPLEVYELIERITIIRLLAFAVNVFAVVYILWTKRLFGVRGGHAAFAAERESDSLLEVERAAMLEPEPTAS